MRNLDFAHSNASHGGTFFEETCQFIFISLALSLISLPVILQIFIPSHDHF